MLMLLFLLLSFPGGAQLYNSARLRYGGNSIAGRVELILLPWWIKGEINFPVDWLCSEWMTSPDAKDSLRKLTTMSRG